MLGRQEFTMSKTNERGAVHDRTLAEERAAARFTMEDILAEELKLRASGTSSDEKVKVTTSKKQMAANRKNAKRSTGPRTSAGKARSAMNSTRHGLRGKFRLIEGEDPEELSKFAEGIRADWKPQGAFEEYSADRFIKDAWLVDRIDNVVAALLVNNESFDDLPADDLLTALERLHRLGLQIFDRMPQIEKHLYDQEASNDRNTQATARNKSDAGSTWDTKSAFAAGLSKAGLDLAEASLVLDRNFRDRLVRMDRGTNRPQSTQTPAEGDRAEGERGAPSTEEAINAIARAFSCKRTAIALLLRYRRTIERSRDNSLRELQRFQAARQGQVVPAPEVVDVNVNFTGKDEERS